MESESSHDIVDVPVGNIFAVFAGDQRQQQQQHLLGSYPQQQQQQHPRSQEQQHPGSQQQHGGASFGSGEAATQSQVLVPTYSPPLHNQVGAPAEGATTSRPAAWSDPKNRIEVCPQGQPTEENNLRQLKASDNLEAAEKMRRQREPEASSSPTGSKDHADKPAKRRRHSARDRMASNSREKSPRRQQGQEARVVGVLGGGDVLSCDCGHTAASPSAVSSCGGGAVVTHQQPQQGSSCCYY